MAVRFSHSAGAHHDGRVGVGDADLHTCTARTQSRIRAFAVGVQGSNQPQGMGSRGYATHQLQWTETRRVSRVSLR
jgi:hypothetical protein